MLSISDVEKVAKLSKLTLSSEELIKFQKLLSEALDYIQVLDELDTSNVSPTFQVTGLENVLAEDISALSLSQKDAIRNAPETKDGFIVTELVIKK